MDLKRVRDEVYALALPRWEQRKAGLPRGKVGWSYSDVSPAMPTAWPPDGRGLLCHYVGAHGYAQGLVDGVMVARPWAKVLADPRGESPATFEILTDEIVELGVQGVRPMSPSASKPSPRDPAVVAEQFDVLWRAPPAAGQPYPYVKESYTFWLRNNGTFAGAIRPLHAEFFAWIDSLPG